MSCGYSSARSYLRATGRSSFSTQVSIASTNSCWSSGGGFTRVSIVCLRFVLVVDLVFDAVATLGDQHRAAEGAHLLAILIGSDCAHRHDSSAWPRTRFALVEHLRRRI